MRIIAWLSVLSLFFMGCSRERVQGSDVSKEHFIYSFAVVELSDKQYPDNPDIGYRSKKYSSDYFKEGELYDNGKDFTFEFESKNGDTIRVENLAILDFIPTIPEALKTDEYLSHIAIVNQEWNRNQVKFVEGEFKSTDSIITRVDIARNCLNAYLWEVIFYTNEDGKELPVYHGWFDFPHDLYGVLFEKVNHVAFKDYKAEIENWKDPAHKVVNRDLLRDTVIPAEVTYTDLSNAMYPLAGAREKKFKEVIYPASFKTMKDLQSDSTTFATFTPPGFYNRADPRKTELGRIYQLELVQLSQIGNGLSEVEFTYKDKEGDRETHLIIGGLDLSKMPVLDNLDANKGWKNSMGFGNHPFYESTETHKEWDVEHNHYYGYLTNEKGEWLDSHAVGIDGPVIYFDKNDKNLLHFWILSFERHTFVSHYSIRVM